MFGASRVLNRVSTKFVKKNFSTTSYREKSFKEAWLSDAGAYPVMAVIVGAVVFCAGTMTWFITAHPDSRVTKSSRKSIFRGDLKGVTA